VQKYLRQHQPNGRASGVELFEKRLEAAEGSPTVSVVSEKNEAAQYAAVKGVSIDSDVDSDTVEINAVAGSGAKWSSKASIRFNVADVQRPLASASKVVAKGNRIVLEEGGSFIQSVSTGEKIALRVERGVYVFDAKYEDGSTGTMALDSGAGVNVWPQDWWSDAPMEPKALGLKMVAANGTEIANLGQKVIQFNAIQPFAGQR